jgi:F0F1-type ATP synthase membrane subunit c/vacuolar-type H+-ATPase subunit K
MKTLETIFAIIGGGIAIAVAAVFIGGGMGIAAGAAYRAFRWFM